MGGSKMPKGIKGESGDQLALFLFPLFIYHVPILFQEPYFHFHIQSS